MQAVLLGSCRAGTSPLLGAVLATVTVVAACCDDEEDGATEAGEIAAGEAMPADRCAANEAADAVYDDNGAVIWSG